MVRNFACFGAEDQERRDRVWNSRLPDFSALVHEYCPSWSEGYAGLDADCLFIQSDKLRSKRNSQSYHRMHSRLEQLRDWVRLEHDHTSLWSNRPYWGGNTGSHALPLPKSRQLGFTMRIPPELAKTTISSRPRKSSRS